MLFVVGIEGGGGLGYREGFWREMGRDLGWRETREEGRKDGKEGRVRGWKVLLNLVVS